MRGLEMLVNPFTRQNPQEDRSPTSQSIDTAEPLEDPLVIRTLKEYDPFKFMKEFVLTPSQILLVNTMILNGYQPDQVHRVHNSQFVSNLVQQSFDSGYNDFILISGESIVEPPYKISGNKTRALRYTLIGPTIGSDILIHCDGMHKDGDVCEYSFRQSRDSRITVYGNTGKSICHGTQDCEFTFYGDVGNEACYAAKRCSFTFHLGAGKCVGYHARESVFRALHEDSYWNLSDFVEKRSDNIVQLIHPDGTVIDEVRK